MIVKSSFVDHCIFNWLSIDVFVKVPAPSEIVWKSWYYDFGNIFKQILPSKSALMLSLTKFTQHLQTISLSRDTRYSFLSSWVGLLRKHVEYWGIYSTFFWSRYETSCVIDKWDIARSSSTCHLLALCQLAPARQEVWERKTRKQ